MPKENPTIEEEPEDHLGMTDEQWAWFKEYTRGYGDQDENGVDLSLLRYNLSLSPTQRLKNNERAVEFLKEMQHAAANAGLRGGSSRSKR